MADDHEHEGLFAAIAVAGILGLAGLMLGVGSCADEEENRTEIERLERRLDNIRDGG